MVSSSIVIQCRIGTLKYLRCPQKLNSQYEYAIAARNELIELIILEGRERDKKSNHIKSQVRTKISTS